MKNVWSRTLLSVFRYLDRIVGAIDRLIEMRALYSQCLTGGGIQLNNTLNLYEKLADLVDRKLLLVNLKVLCTNALANIDERLARSLIAKYIDGRSSMEAAMLLNVCPRTYFRYVIIAEKNFEDELAKQGYNSERLEQECKNEGWIIEAYNNIFRAGDDESFVLSGKELKKVYSNYKAASL